MPLVDLPAALEPSDLEYLMIDVTSLDIRSAYGPDLDESDYFYGTSKDLQYAQGPVAEKVAHVTLLPGIIPSENYREEVSAAISGMKWPKTVHISNIDFFNPTNPEDDYYVIVAKVSPEEDLMRMHTALAKDLDYYSIYTYTPHVTLAYIKKSANLEEWLGRMTVAYADKRIETLGMNYGDD